ncbi:hypothetical protein C488_14992 [Natrinema pellirubrum DSM 15624]|uniref:Uncharacterized protein n=1 Tax=Natrinema pellirubrum (strain DSM 15624 / CIP 106293 / JCM 10476 / NCIMB 786 / 157) TaxID=797303 RepID=L9YEK5_NATP1|nr:hypothetical protein C488_14992 [Natrinema pellirubrum DSM 15624]
MNTLLDLSKNRLAINQKRQRKNGLEYTERGVLLMEDADIPDEGAATGQTDSGTGEAVAGLLTPP